MTKKSEKRKRKLFIAIAGNIGVGKTTLTRLLSQKLHWRAYYERVIDNPYLAPFYDDMDRWSFHLQIYFLSHRFKSQKEITEWPDSCIQDRSIYEDVEIFARTLNNQGFMTNVDYENYRMLFETMVDYLRKPDLIIYLKASVDQLVERILSRGRDYEQTIDRGYLEQLGQAYETWLDEAEKNDFKILRIDTKNKNFEEDEKELKVIVDYIKEMENQSCGLIVSYYFPPTGGGGVQRWLKLIKYLSRGEWEFSVLANDQSTSIPIDKSLLLEIPENLKVIRTPSTNRSESINNKTSLSLFRQSGYWQRWISAFFRITDSRYGWNAVAEEYIRKELNNSNIDLIILTSPPYSLAFLAASLGSSVNCPVILDMRDPWTINPYKIYPTIIHRLLDKRRENESLSKISFLISAYQSTIDDYKKRIKNFKSKKILFLPNGYDEEDFSRLEKPESFRGGQFNIGFSGTVYSHLNKPNPIFKAMTKLIKNGVDIHFHHVGTSVHDLSKLAKRYNINGNVHLWGYRNHKASLRILQMMDALCLILDERWPQAENTIGGKFYEYLRLKIPIFALVPENGEAANIIKNTDSGLIVSCNDEMEVTQELSNLLEKKYKFTWRGIEKFSRENQAQVLNQFLESIL